VTDVVITTSWVSCSSRRLRAVSGCSWRTRLTSSGWLVDYLAGKLGIEDASWVKRYTARLKTPYEHAWEIRGAYGFAVFEDEEVAADGQVLPQPRPGSVRAVWGSWPRCALRQATSIRTLSPTPEPDLARVVEVLDRHGGEYLIVGGEATQLDGATRPTNRWRRFGPPGRRQLGPVRRRN